LAERPYCGTDDACIRRRHWTDFRDMLGKCTKFGLALQF
jgi:hypothetical protein